MKQTIVFLGWLLMVLTRNVVSVEIKNTGRMGGDEIVQLYIHQKVSNVVRPVKELKGSGGSISYRGSE